MAEKYAIVVTTINPPTKAVRAIAEGAARLKASFILAGDRKSPKDFHQPGAKFLDLEKQQKSGFRYGAEAPVAHYARKNIGYLEAIREGATIIIETDDDNIPLDAFWAPRKLEVEARLVKEGDWINIYRFFSDGFIWPRGLPLEMLQRDISFTEPQIKKVHAPIQQGLANGDPDVDAIYRLAYPLPFTFEDRESVALDSVWCPFNSQNTTWWKETFPLLYLPFHCSFRMTDIWRSFVAQRIAHLNGWPILFHAATVFQERNEHNLLRDFEEEIPGYLGNEKIRKILMSLDLKSSIKNIPDNLIACYRALVENSFVGEQELPLLDAWLEDFARLS